MHSPPYLRDLNPEQREAALTTEGPVLVLAGAGSGKTRMLIQRIVHLIRSGIPAKRILAVTFTNRAADEMRERAVRAVGKEGKGVTISTFHSLGVRILRNHGERIGLPPDFAIYATGDQLGVIRRIIAEEVHVVATAGDDRYDSKRVLHEISRWKNQLATPADAAREVSEGSIQENRSDDYAVLAAAVYPRYEESLRAAGACDFDDLLLLPVELLREHSEVRERLWGRWHYLMVDEYQDTNGAQLELARLLAGPRKNLCVVGDDDQSIYAWRGADLRNILDFEQHFPGARVITLEENYRSTQRILDAANAVILNNLNRKAKRMRTGNGPGPKLDYWQIGGTAAKSAEEEEAEMIAREIGIRRFHEKLSWSDFAVLYRTNLQARPLEESLRAANIPYRVIGGTSYFDRKEVADAVAYLRVALNPRDEVALRRIINYPARGIGRTSLLRLIEAAREAKRPLWDVLEVADASGELKGAQAEAVNRFVELIRSAGESYRSVDSAAPPVSGTGALAKWVEELLDATGLERAIRSENPSARAAEIRIDNLRDLIASVASYESRAWADPATPEEDLDWEPPSLRGFLERVSLIGDLENDSREEEPGERVTLLTLHSAKGLEFAHVFLVGLEEEILPHARTVAELSSASAATSGDPLAEERRLFYVGITRARHRLTLSGCRTRNRAGEALPRQPSRFLAEIPTELLEVRAGTVASSLTDADRVQLKQNFFAHMREILEP